MMIELPEKLEAALKVQANAHGVSPAGYVCAVSYTHLDVYKRQGLDLQGRFKLLWKFNHHG